MSERGFALETFLEQSGTRVGGWLEARMERMRTRVPPGLHEAMAYSLLGGGKRLRPILCLAFARATGGGDEKLVEDACCALEMVHTYSLIHDDLPAMDDDDLRRGRPTNHKVFGEAMAILAGDALLTEAFSALCGAGGTIRGLLCGELARAAGASGMVGGQALDIAEDRPAEVDYLVRLHNLKTGELIRAACRMGAIAAEAGPDALEAADIYGRAVGLTFQIADDLLDVTSTPEVMGKPTGADAAAHRATFPEVLGVGRAKEMAEAQVNAATRAIAPIEPGEGPLVALARYALEREK